MSDLELIDVVDRSQTLSDRPGSRPPLLDSAKVPHRWLETLAASGQTSRHWVVQGQGEGDLGCFGVKASLASSSLSSPRLRNSSTTFV